MRFGGGIILVVAALAWLTFPAACQLVNGRSSASGRSASFGGPPTAGTTQKFLELAKDDHVLVHVIDFLVADTNRKQPSEGRYKRDILSGTKQSLRTGDIYHAKVLLAGGSKGLEVAEGSVFHGVNGRQTVLKLDVGRVGPMELAELMGDSPSEDIGSTVNNAVAEQSNGLAAEMEFDLGFLDGIEVQAAGAASTGASTVTENFRSAHIDSAAIRRLQMQADVPLKPRGSRGQQKSRLSKA